MTNIFSRSVLLMLLILGSNTTLTAEEKTPLQLAWKDNLLQVSGEHVPGKVLEIWYLEAYCRPGSTDRDWHETVIEHETKLISINPEKTQLQLSCLLADGVTVQHLITATHDDVTFEIETHNPTDQISQAHWAQPCVRVGEFTGKTGEDKYAYVPQCFIVIDGEQQMLPTTPWATAARYTPGQVWALPGVSRDDVNPRPLSTLQPSHPIMGCVSEDRQQLLAITFDPTQELFQGVIRCLHADFRLGGLDPGERKKIRGKLYLLKNDFPALMKRYETDFPQATE